MAFVESEVVSQAGEETHDLSVYTWSRSNIRMEDVDKFMANNAAIWNCSHNLGTY